MRISVTMIAMLVCGFAALLSVLVAVAAVERIESVSRLGIEESFVLHDADWATVTVDGLRVILTGTAPSEAQRFQALSLAGEVVDPHRVIDAMNVQAVADMAPPEFSIEILRNDNGISVIGLIPLRSDRAAFVSALESVAGGAQITDLLETADFQTPENWEISVGYALGALSVLPRSKISVLPGAVTITAITESVESRSRLQRRLLDDAPPKLDLMLDLSAPRPVITPFTLRFLIEDGVGRFDACSADSEVTSALILSAAQSAGMSADVECTIGLGQPSPNWGKAVVSAIQALANLGGGSITFSNADLTLVAEKGVQEEEFDRIIAQLDSDLPDIFSLHAVFPEPEEVESKSRDDARPEFIATLSPEGQVQLRGRINDDVFRSAAESYAHSRFGTEMVYSAVGLNDELPAGWSLRVLAGLEALAQLANGQVIVHAEDVRVSGSTGNENAKAEISRILSDKLGEAQKFSIEVTYVKTLDPLANIPTAEECVGDINRVLSASKISFDPGSADISEDASETLKVLADQVRRCEHVEMEIEGHTDSQGREVMNQSLSQARADAVLNALLARRVLTRNLTAKGYGETRPIADNNSEEGREANRRITFSLIETEGGEAEATQNETENEPN